MAARVLCGPCVRSPVALLHTTGAAHLFSGVFSGRQRQPISNVNANERRIGAELCASSGGGGRLQSQSSAPAAPTKQFTGPLHAGAHELRARQLLRSQQKQVFTGTSATATATAISSVGERSVDCRVRRLLRLQRTAQTRFYTVCAAGVHNVASAHASARVRATLRHRAAAAAAARDLTAQCRVRPVVRIGDLFCMNITND